MNVARLLYPVRVLGPGDRIGLWVCGCSRGCEGCSNPELWEQRDEYEIALSELLSLIQRISVSHSVDGFTISGGEPMDQAKELSELIQQIQIIADDILIYSGYKLEELKKRSDPYTEHILRTAAVLIDGAYIEELNQDSVLRGSSNQCVHILNPKYQERYDHYFSTAHNQIQNFTTSDGIVSVGIHHRSFGPPL